MAAAASGNRSTSVSDQFRGGRFETSAKNRLDTVAVCPILRDPFQKGQKPWICNRRFQSYRRGAHAWPLLSPIFEPTGSEKNVTGGVYCRGRGTREKLFRLLFKALKNASISA